MTGKAIFENFPRDLDFVLFVLYCMTCGLYHDVLIQCTRCDVILIMACAMFACGTVRAGEIVSNLGGKFMGVQGRCTSLCWDQLRGICILYCDANGNC